MKSKKNISELVKAVSILEDNENRYVIAIDNFFDNLQDIICFEYILLEFKDLIEWIYASDDEFLTKRKNAIVAREKFVKIIQSGEVNYKNIREIIEYLRTK